MTSRDEHYLRMAARLALRGAGGAAPNPLVGCVVVDANDVVVGWGYHRLCGGPHAEVVALERAGSKASGATAYVTLEPCNSTGRTGACSEALIEAGVARVVYAQSDPHPKFGGGAERLLEAGITVERVAESNAALVSRAFVHRVRTGLPWVVAKWAQTIDGRIATRTGESQWISNARSRQMVHRARGRVDAIMTGIGTVLADDPQLTARHGRVRRVAKRVVIDPKLQTPLDANLVRTARDVSTIIACQQSLLDADDPRGAEMRDAGVKLIGIPLDDQHVMPLQPVLRALADQYGVSDILVEAGAGLLGRLFQQRLVAEAWVFTAPLLLGDAQSLPCVRGLTTDRLTDGVSTRLIDLRRRCDDIVARYGCDAASA